jgi:nifR3 family TIM-barrel protein
MNIPPKNSNGCPHLILAPMEGVGDQCFRKAMASVGGFNEAVRDFLRVPSNAHVKSLAVRYDSTELLPIPLAAQIMGSDSDLMAEMTREMASRGALRVDLNCGCPSNTVTGRGAGSSLLKDPELLYEVAKAMVEAVDIPVTAKLRSGFDDTSLFKENLLAAQESGIRYITLHPRTKAEGYGPPANWDLIAEAKALLKIPVVGNGDILSVDDALRMLSHTQCDALMIGRGSLVNPFIFQEIQAHYDKKPYNWQWTDLERYISVYVKEMPEAMSEKTRVGKLKQLFSFLFRSTHALQELRPKVLTSPHKDVHSFLLDALPLLLKGMN